MSFEVFERRLRERLEEVTMEKQSFHSAWGGLRSMLVEPMLKSAAKIFTERNLLSSYTPRDEEVALYVTDFYRQTRRLRFWADGDRLQIGYSEVSYREGDKIPVESEDTMRFLALAEISQLSVERIILAFSERVARAKSPA
jgi:hypothetical protein